MRQSQPFVPTFADCDRRHGHFWKTPRGASRIGEVRVASAAFHHANDVPRHNKQHARCSVPCADSASSVCMHEVCCMGARMEWRASVPLSIAASGSRSSPTLRNLECQARPPLSGVEATLILRRVNHLSSYFLPHSLQRSHRSEMPNLTLLTPYAYYKSTCGYCSPAGQRSKGETSLSYGSECQELLSIEPCS